MLAKPLAARTYLSSIVTELYDAKMVYGWKGNSMLTNYLAACAHLTITVSETERYICEMNNIVTLKSGLEVTQGHLKWYHSKAWVRFSIRLP